MDKLAEMGKKAGNVSPSQVALAWILAEYPNCAWFILLSSSMVYIFLVFPIPGCRSVERLEENAASAELRLLPEDVKAIRKLAEEADGTNGDRYSPQYVSDGKCIPLSEWKGE